MRAKKAKAIRKFLGKPLPQITGVPTGPVRKLKVGNTFVDFQSYVPRELTDDEKQTKSEYRRLKQMYKNGELPL
jgi:hypothetical protein